MARAEVKIQVKIVGREIFGEGLEHEWLEIGLEPCAMIQLGKKSFLDLLAGETERIVKRMIGEPYL
jgi:hypothetical protein